ncbi:hypothetical protein [Streptomyces salinarius]|uniref:hypothetical protein n=1 Tax=Streptomyces salinarius TaxID=2762598 RepID=UPI0028527434|nr:hypothetical protein [Streptomyces salinarius]
MANCCGAARCTCRVTAGPGITVEGNGSAGAPYVISGETGLTAVEAADTPTVDTTVAGTGVTGDPYVVSAAVILDPAPPAGGTNLIQTGPDGLYLECAQVRTCLVAGTGITYDETTGTISAEAVAEPLVTEDSPCIALTGDGTAGAPLTAAPVIDPAPGNALACGPDGLLVTPGAVSCDDVRPCLSAGDGIAYDPDTGIIAARPSTDPDNLVGFGTDGGLYAAAPAAEPTVVEAGTGTTVTGTGTAADPYTVSATPPETGCGLTGDGSTGSPLSAAVAAWPYPCDVDDAGGGVYCDSAGQLRSEPRGQIAFQQNQQTLDFADETVPSPQDTEVATHSIDIVNPDACREAFVLLEAETDADFNLPAGAGAALGMSTDEMSYLRNSGSTAILDTHVQGTKVINAGTIPPGGTLTYTLPITMGRGSGGATYNRVQSFVRAFVFVL